MAILRKFKDNTPIQIDLLQHTYQKKDLVPEDVKT